MKKLVLGAVFALTACTTTSGGNFQTEALDQITIGSSTTSHVRQIVGEPYRKQIKTDGTEQWNYSFYKSSRSLGAEAFIPYVGVFLPNSQRASMEAKELNLTFENDVLATCLLTLTAGEGSGSVYNQTSVAEAFDGTTTEEIACGGTE